MELRAFLQYCLPDCPLTYYRSSSGIEVDFILGEKELALEIKASARVHEGDIKHLKALMEDGPVKKAMVVSMENLPRHLESGIETCPWQDFIHRLWSGEFIK